MFSSYYNQMKQPSACKIPTNCDDSLSTQTRSLQRFSRSKRDLHSRSPSRKSQSSPMARFYIKQTFQVNQSEHSNQKCNEGLQQKHCQICSAQVAKEYNTSISNIERLISKNVVNRSTIDIEDMLSEYNNLKSSFRQYVELSQKQSKQIGCLQENNVLLMNKVNGLNRSLIDKQAQTQELLREIKFLKNKIPNQNKIEETNLNGIQKIKQSVIRARNSEIQAQKKILQNTIQSLKQQIKMLKNYNTNKEYLEDCLLHFQSQLFSAREQIKKLNLEITIVKRKKHLEYQMLLKLKDSEVSQLKKKYTSTMDSLCQTKKILTEYIFKFKHLQRIQINQQNKKDTQDLKSMDFSILTLSEQSFTQQ